MTKKNDTTLPVLTHILSWLTGFLGPLIILLATKDKNAKNHARLALNWQFSMLIYVVISMILMFVFIGFLTLFALAVMNIIFCIVAAVKAGNGILWKYPMSIPFFKQQ
ncbi:DUF4870 domain-containing protein [Candidatus Woesearchaeota archaeon]|nr:DUF4870 domain-containing protein [Candidatus Woesearchaeota archaeon]